MVRADGVDDGHKVIVDLGAEGGASERPVGTLPTAPERHTSVWIVVVAYAVALTALALAIYGRYA